MGERVPLENLPPAVRAAIQPGTPAFQAYAADFERQAQLPKGALTGATFNVQPGTDPLDLLTKVAADKTKNLPVRTGAEAIPTEAEARGEKYTRPADSPRDPTKGESGWNLFNAAMGKSVADTWLGLKQRVGMATQDEVDEVRKRDAPLMDTPQGVGGYLVGTMLQTALPAKTLAQAATLVKAAPIAAAAPTLVRAATSPLTQGATLGAGFNATQPVASGESLAGNVGEGAAFGLAGAALPAAVRAAGTAAKNAATPAVAALADVAQNHGIDLRAAQVSGNPVTKLVTAGLDRLPFSGTGTLQEAQRQQLNTALSRTMGEDSPDALAALQSARKNLGGKFNALNADNDVQLDPWHVDSFNDIINDFRAKGLSDAKPVDVKKLQDFTRAIVNSTDANGVIPGPQYQSLRTDLGTIANGGAGTPSYRGAVDSLKGVLDKAFDSGLSPGDLQAKGVLRQQWSNMKDLEKIAPKDASGTFDLNRLPSVMNSSARSNSYNQGRMIQGWGDQDLPDLARIAAQFYPKTSGGAPAVTSDALASVAKKAIAPAAVAGSLYALNHDEPGGVAKSAMELGGLGAVSALLGRGANSQWFAQGSPLLRSLGDAGLKLGAPSAVGGLNALKAEVPAESAP